MTEGRVLVGYIGGTIVQDADTRMWRSIGLYNDSAWLV